MKTLELISFDLCPFVQRSRITLLKKQVDHKVTNIDLKNKPQWFLNISPLGKVPCLKVGDDILFESSVINEYLDETTGGEFLPKDPLKKAQIRAWIEFTSTLTSSWYSMTMSKTKEDYDERKEIFQGQLNRLEKNITGDTTFDDSGFTLADTCILPIIQRTKLLDDHYKTSFLSDKPKLKNIGLEHLEKPYVLESVPSDFSQRMVAFLFDAEVYLSR
ncbi:glutathione S-transferase family protein [Halobacteriovorax sp. HLS]|uniref:glutathione S-transferase family protein n=1 Tax=Halobacteriovorax sp. HLS TaxID=2234000 RepID=UPI000FD6C43C|nr:glutathione S-transferase family protein [Halobacteriovorax sp. HLS]